MSDYYEKGLHAFVKVANLLRMPLNLTNFFVPLVGCIWLAILGEWKLIVYSLLSFFVSSVGLFVIMIPNLLFIAPDSSLSKKENKAVFYLLGFISSVYSFSVVIIWCFVVLNFFMEKISFASRIPLLLWSYFVAIAPIEWVVGKELMRKANEFAKIPTLFVYVGYILVIISILIFGVSLIHSSYLFGAIMLIGFAILFPASVLLEKEKNHAEN